MARKKKSHSGHTNHERWIVSYADFVTLLFAFFVVMFATANADRSKAKVVADAVRAALDEGSKAPSVSGVLEQAVRSNRDSARKAVEMAQIAERYNGDPKLASMLEERTRTFVELVPSMKALEHELKYEIRQGQVQLHMEPRGLAISFKQAALFDSGYATIKPTAYPAMEKVAETVKKLPNLLRLEGHTDNLPIHNERFRNNWELSASRSIAILEILVGRCHVPAKRLGVSGFAEVAPIASNDTEEGRAMNRRVDVVILSEIASKTEPGGRPLAPKN